MAGFKDAYPSERSPEELWRVINTPLLDPDLASQVHEDLAVRYEYLAPDGQINGGSTITYVPTDTAVQKVPLVLRQRIPKDVSFFVAQISPDYAANQGLLRLDVLMSEKHQGSVTRTVEAEGDGSILVVEATLAIGGLGQQGDMFDSMIVKALAHTIGGSSERTVALAQKILAL
jgi:hypothetical protein